MLVDKAVTKFFGVSSVEYKQLMQQFGCPGDVSQYLYLKNTIGIQALEEYKKQLS